VHLRDENLVVVRQRRAQLLQRDRAARQRLAETAVGREGDVGVHRLAHARNGKMRQCIDAHRLLERPDSCEQRRVLRVTLERALHFVDRFRQRGVGFHFRVDRHELAAHFGQFVALKCHLDAADVREVLARRNEPRIRAVDLRQFPAQVTMRAENQVDARHGPREFIVGLQMLVPDHDHGVDVLVVAQGAHDLARGRDGIAKHKAAPLHQRRKIGSGDGKDADSDSLALQYVVGLKAARVRAQDRIADGLAARGEVLRAVVGIVIAEGHVIDDAVEPWPFRAAVFVGPRRRPFVDHIAAAEDESAAFLLGSEIADRAGNAPAVGAFLGVKRNCVGVVIRKLQKGYGNCRRDHFPSAPCISLMAASRPFSFAVF